VLSLQTANFEFYDALEKTCCHELQHINIPVFQPSTTDIRAGQLLTPTGLQLTTRVGNKDTGKHDIGSGMTNLSLALSLGQFG